MKARFVDTDTLFRAFANGTRLRLLNLLLRGEVCVCDLCTVLGVLQPSVSRHLAYLNRAGLVTVRQRGKWKYYAVRSKPTGVHRTLLNCVRTCLGDIDLLRADRMKLRELRSRGKCGKTAGDRRPRFGPSSKGGIR